MSNQQFSPGPKGIGSREDKRRKPKKTWMVIAAVLGASGTLLGAVVGFGWLIWNMSETAHETKDEIKTFVHDEIGTVTSKIQETSSSLQVLTERTSNMSSRLDRMAGQLDRMAERLLGMQRTNTTQQE